MSQTFGGRYQASSNIGYGAFASIYRASQQNPERPVALKILHPHLHQNEQAKERFLREARLIASLSHPNTIRLYEYGEHNGLLWIALEWLEGEDLCAHIKRRGVIPQEEIAALFLPVLGAIEEAHQRGVVHRDLSAKNIFVLSLPNQKRALKLIDFGLSGALDSTLTVGSEVSGTPQYMPPEQWEGLHQTTSAGDIYSLGVILYQCLCGSLPFEASGVKAWLSAHKSSPKPLPSSIHEPLRSMVMSMLSKEPSHRPTLEQLQQALSGKRSAPPSRARARYAAVFLLPLVWWGIQGTPNKRTAASSQPSSWIEKDHATEDVGVPIQTTPSTEASTPNEEALQTTCEGAGCFAVNEAKAQPKKIEPTTQANARPNPDFEAGGIRDPFHP